MNKYKASGIFLSIAGLLTLILGLYLILFPAEKYSTNISILSLGFVIIGFFYIMSYVANKKWHFRPGWTLSQGFYILIIGILCLYTFDKELSDSMNLLFAMWALSSSTSQIAASIKIRSLEYTKWWRILIFGIINLIAFVYFIVDPLSNMIAIYYSLGGYIIISGLICLLELLNYKTTID